MYTIIDSLLPQFPVSINSACSCLNISRSQYYDWKIRNDSLNQSDPFEIQIKDKIHQIAIEFPRYGYRRITKELHRRGLQINSKRVLNLMREDNLLCIKKTFVPRTTDSNHNHKIYPNLARDVEITRINQLWVSDITYIQLPNEFIYLAVIIDVGSRRCIGWDLDRNIDTQLTLNALYKALECRAGQDLNDLIHHSDQGVQYASNAYIKCLREHDICISMSRKGNPYDNHYTSYCTSSILSVIFSSLDRQVGLFCFAHLIGRFSPGSSYSTIPLSLYGLLFKIPAFPHFFTVAKCTPIRSASSSAVRNPCSRRCS
jgi:transposase InsO family protein